MVKSSIMRKRHATCDVASLALRPEGGGFPLPCLGGYPCPVWGDTTWPGEGVPHLLSWPGYTPQPGLGVPVLPKGVPPSSVLAGVHPPPPSRAWNRTLDRTSDRTRGYPSGKYLGPEAGNPPPKKKDKGPDLGPEIGFPPCRQTDRRL